MPPEYDTAAPAREGIPERTRLHPSCRLRHGIPLFLKGLLVPLGGKSSSGLPAAALTRTLHEGCNYSDAAQVRVQGFGGLSFAETNESDPYLARTKMGKAWTAAES